MDHIAFENELCARLLAQAQALRRELAARAWEANLVPTDFLALRHMIRSSYRVSPGEIARALECSRSNATKIIKRLETAGYVRTSVSVFAPKSKSIEITTEGRNAYARAHHRHDRFDRFARLSQEERRELYRLLGLVGPGVRALTPVG
jgi:DNA-binding MarR family transcriptional regulator